MWYQVEHEFSLIFLLPLDIILCNAESTCCSGWIYWVDIMSNQCLSALWHRERKWKKSNSGWTWAETKDESHGHKVGHFLVCQAWHELRHSSLVISSNTGKICAFVNLGFVLFVVVFSLLLDMHTKADAHTELMFAILRKALWVNLSDPMKRKCLQRLCMELFSWFGRWHRLVLSTNLGPRKPDFTAELYDSEHNYGFLWVSVFWSAIQKSWHLPHNMIVRILWVSIHNVLNIMPQRSLSAQ